MANLDLKGVPLNAKFLYHDRKLPGGAVVKPAVMYTNSTAVWPVIRTTYPGSPAEPDRFTLILNSDLEVASEHGKRYFEYLFVHEFGHVLGLHHTPLGCSYKTSVMVERFYGDEVIVTPTAADKTALSHLIHIH